MVLGVPSVHPSSCIMRVPNIRISPHGSRGHHLVCVVHWLVVGPVYTPANLPIGNRKPFHSRVAVLGLSSLVVDAKRAGCHSRETVTDRLEAWQHVHEYYSCRGCGWKNCCGRLAAMQSAFYLSVEDVAAVGFLNRQGFQVRVETQLMIVCLCCLCQVFLLDVIVDGSYQQILRRYADFVALQVSAWYSTTRYPQRIIAIILRRLLWKRCTRRRETMLLCHICQVRLKIVHFFLSLSLYVFSITSRLQAAVPSQAVEGRNCSCSTTWAHNTILQGTANCINNPLIIIMIKLPTGTDRTNSRSHRLSHSDTISLTEWLWYSNEKVCRHKLNNIFLFKSTHGKCMLFCVWLAPADGTFPVLNLRPSQIWYHKVH